jgi:peptidyl-prolyl cis-trans isomerase SurA
VAENAQRIMESLSNGSVTFQDAAHRFSEASSAASGGDLGWLRLTQLPASIAEAAQAMAQGQMAGPIESPGGISILLMIDKRRVLTADPRDATLSLKQVSLTFPAGTTAARSNELAGNFQTRTRAIAGCGMADQVANELGAEVISRDQIAMRDLPAPLQSALGAMQIGQVTQMFGSPQQGVSVLVLCGREMPAAATTPTVDDVADRIQQERVQRRAQRYMRDLRRDAVIDYS